MKFNSMKITGLALLSAISLSACKPDKEEPNAIITGLVSGAIRSAASGNCAVSLNLATLYSGAIIQNAVNTTTIFTQADYEAASTTTVGAGQTYETYAQVPYNVKYDAFIRGGGAYATERTNDINSAKAAVDAASYLGIAAATCSAASTTSGATLQTILDTWFGTFSTTEQTAIDAVFTNAGGARANIRAAFAGGCGVIAGALATTYTGFGGSTATASAYQARQAFGNGAAILACGRIPRSSCTFAALTTADRTTAIRNGVAAVNDVANNQDCAKSDADFTNRTIRNSFTGVPRGTVISGFAFRGDLTANPSDTTIAISEGTTAPNNLIYAASAYPISGALRAISTNFAVAFPMTTGSTAQATGNGTIPYYGASNINVAVVDSCEAFGLQSFGTGTNVTATTALSTYKTLTPAAEVAYAFSSSNTAATLYATTRGAVQDTTNAAGNDAIACNNSFRSRFSIPVAIGGGRLPSLENAVSGNGGATATLTTCLYGGTATSLATSTTLLSSTVPGIQACPAQARGAAASFGDTGLNTLANFPNN